MRNLVAKIAMGLFAALAIHPAYGFARSPADLSPATKEPERFAFVVGNGQYQRSNSNLDDLPDACGEAIQFRKKLLDMGWSADHIFPKVKAPALGETSDDAIQEAVCDKTSHDLQRQLGAFVDVLLLNQNNPYGVIYYAGHGAQSNDEFYGFGVDAVVHLDEETTLLSQYTNYEVFSRPTTPDGDGPTGVNLTRLAADVNGPRGKALLMIVDACRDDPILDQFIAPRINPLTLSPEQRLRLSIGYISSRPDKYDELLRNVVVMFAGRPGRPVQSGTASDPNWFSQHLFGYMDDATNLGAPAPTFVSTFESEAKGDQGGVEAGLRQIPQHVGSMWGSPVFCFKGCAQPLAVWANEKTELIPETDQVRQSVRTPTASLHRQGQRRARLLRANMTTMAAKSPLGSEVRSGETASPQLSAASVPPRPVNFDVFYCAGDSLEAQRREAARAFAEATRQSKPRTFALENTFIDQIRLRSFDINVNLGLKRPRTGTTLVLIKSDPSSSAWREQFRSQFDKIYADDVTKGYLRAYFCTDFSSSEKPLPLVYTQVSHKAEVPQAQQYLDRVSASLPGLRFAEDIEAVDDTHPGKPHTPNRTQIRCYAAEPCAQARKLKEKLEGLIGAPVLVVEMHHTGLAVPSNPVLELWFGLDEMKSWNSVVAPG